jgi:hypothetical protein
MIPDRIAMKPVYRMLFIPSVLLVAAILLAWAGYAYWSRPDRLSEAECRALVDQAWARGRQMAPEGPRILEYDLGGRIHRVRSKSPSPEGTSMIAERLRAVFPQRKPDDVFFGNVLVSHAGRLRTGGRICEKIRLSPRSYRGDSAEIWVDPSSGDVLGWRRYDSSGRFVRGFRLGRSFGEVEQMPPPELPGGGLDVPLVPPDKVGRMVQNGELLMPARLPEGFELVGGRELRVFGFFGPGGIGMGGRGMGRAYEGFAPDEMNFQLVFSDGLNTISVLQYRLPRFLELLPRMEVFDAALKQKAQEITRIFHTSMQSRMVPGGLVLLYGEVDADVLSKVADSIPPEGFKIGAPGFRPPEGPPPGFQPPDGGPMGGPFGEGFGRRRGQGGPPESDPE